MLKLGHWSIDDDDEELGDDDAQGLGKVGSRWRRSNPEDVCLCSLDGNVFGKDLIDGR